MQTSDIKKNRHSLPKKNQETTHYCLIQSPLGKLLLAGNDQTLTHLFFQDGRHPIKPDPRWSYCETGLRKPIQQLNEYFSGKRQSFTIKLAPEGTAFQQKVWSALRAIPYGQTVSYGEIAKAIGKPKASRAVGTANGRNPISIIVPCHRVIGSNGKLVGYGGGLPIKEALLSLEEQHQQKKP